MTVLILVSPYLAFGIRSPSAHLVLDSVDTCVALLVAYLVYGRYLRGQRVQDLLLFSGLVLLAVAGLGLSHVTELVTSVRPATLDVWLPLSVRVIGALAIAVAALAGQREFHPSGWFHWPALLPLAVVAVVFGLLWNWRSELPVALELGELPSSARDPLVSGSSTLLLAQAVSALCFFTASIAFTVQAVGSEDELLRWLGPGCALAGFSRLNYALFPSLYTDWLYTGDLLRTGCYLLLLVGAGREIGRYWNAQTEVAVLQDRRRLARELHDGVIQELGFIRSQSYAIPAGTGSRELILGACDRALDEARAAVHALGRDSDEPLGSALRRAVTDLAQRHDVRLEFELDESVAATGEQRHAVVRIAREAVSNAVRHGRADRVRVVLAKAAGECLLTVADDGTGFDVGTGQAAGGYGLISMRDRARGLGGAFELQSAPGRGSVVTVRW